MNCPQCGSVVMDGAKFCTTCGFQIQAPVAAAMQQAVQEAPVYEAPAAPVYEAPQAPVYEAPQAPVYEAPVYEAPVYEAPVYEAPAYEAPQAPVYEAPAPQAPVYEAPQAPVYEAPQAPVYEAPQAPAYGAPAPQYQAPQFQQPQGQPNPYAFQPQPEAPKQKKKGKTGLIIGIVAGVLALAAIAFILIKFVFGAPKAQPVDVNLNDYVVVTVTGISGNGEAEVKFDMNKLHDDFDEALVWTCKKKNQPETSVTDLLCENISVYLSDYYYLSNGDQITVEVYDYFSEYNEYLEDYYGNNAVVTSSNFTYTVSGLEEPVTFDPFEGAVVTITGSEGNTWADITLRDDLDAMDYLYITTDDDTWSLKNGDVITYYVYGYDELEQEILIELYGMYPSVTEWTYTVEGLEREGFIEDAADIPASFAASCLGAVKEYLGGVYGGADYLEAGVSFNGAELVGFYYWTLKDGASDIDTNVFYAITKNTLTVAESADKTTTIEYYYCARLTDLYLNTDGTVTFYEGDFFDYNVLDYTFEYMWSTSTDDWTLTVNGTQTLAEMQSAIKAEESDHFTFVSDLE